MEPIQFATELAQQPVKTIIAATDFSRPAAVGIRWAAEVAKRHRARLILAHVLPSTIAASAAPEFLSVPDLTRDELSRRASESLAQTAKRLRTEGVDVIIEVLEGVPAATLLRLVKRNEAGLLVAGLHGRTRFPGLLYGSTAARLLQKSPCPVMTFRASEHGGTDAVSAVGAEAAFATGDEDDIRRLENIKSVLLPTDFSADAELAAHAAVNILGEPARRATFVLLHAYHLPYDLDGALLHGVHEHWPAVGEAAKEWLEKLARPLRDIDLRVETVVKEGYPPEVILATAEKHESDLIAMGVHGLSGLKRLVLGSTAERVLPHAPCPVLTVRR